MVRCQWFADHLQLTTDHHLVTSGPYARIRHPLYSAMFGWVGVLALLTANWIFVGLAALSIAGLVGRVEPDPGLAPERPTPQRRSDRGLTARGFGRRLRPKPA